MRSFNLVDTNLLHLHTPGVNKGSLSPGGLIRCTLFTGLNIVSIFSFFNILPMPSAVPLTQGRNALLTFSLVVAVKDLKKAELLIGWADLFLNNVF